MPALTPLPEAPDAAFDRSTYRARVGHWAGALDEVRWGYYRGWLHGQVRRGLIRKRWFEVVIPAPGATLVLRLQDDGLAAHGRLLLLDPATGDARVALHQTGAPLRTLVVGFMAAEGTEAFLRQGHAKVALRRVAGEPAWSLTGAWGDVTLDLHLDTTGAPEPTMVVGEAAPPYDHRPGLTQHHAGLTVSGSASVGGAPLDLRGALAHLTYTNVFLPPVVEVRRVLAGGALPDGRPFALAISDGDLHGDTREHTLWVDGRPWLLPPARVLVDEHTGDGSIASTNGALDLRFALQARHAAQDRRRFGYVDHSWSWLSGTVSGALPLPDGTTAHVTSAPALATWTRLKG